MICIAIAVPEGLVCATDSSIYGTVGVASGVQGTSIRVLSLSANHLLLFGKYIAVANIGIPIIPTKTGQQRSLSSILESISMDYGPETRIEELLHDFQNRLKLAINDYLQTGLDVEGLPIDLIIAGFNRNKIGHLVRMTLNNIEYGRSTDNPGCGWFGFGEVVNRLILGHDQRLPNPQEARYEYIIPWGVMTLQDAVNLSTSLINITKEVSKYVHGIIKPTGEVESIAPLAGGNIDVAVITNEQAKFLSRKELSIESKSGPRFPYF